MSHETFRYTENLRLKVEVEKELVCFRMSCADFQSDLRSSKKRYFRDVIAVVNHLFKNLVMSAESNNWLQIKYLTIVIFCAFFEIS